ncbi:ABC transporter permease protein [Oryzomicrobium terrae]|uniref:ABC transporter permease protein n=1 Tax=Oryzomicrobium terrae TaxID=1735038 RepID=A0A5C1E8I6_9RHOO|nr:ABC transporter permease [Oryzomicrobium terrae]QEL65286.1 ABC transporter permease protein [Oryzomicrobium terrae]
MLAALIRKEFLALSRDLHGLGALFLMPLLFIVVMSLALKNAYNPPADTLGYAIVQADRGAAATVFVDRWAERHGQPRPLPENWRAALAGNRLKYVLVVEDDFSATVAAPQAPAAPPLRLVTEPGLDGGVQRVTAAQVAALVGEVRAQFLMERFMGLAPAGAAEIDRFIATERGGAAGEAGRSGRLTAVQHSVPAWLIFGMFFVVAAMANLLVQERADGTLLRLSALGVPDGIQVAAKAIPYFAVNAVQALLMLAVGVWLMPLLGGDGLSLAGVSIAALTTILAAVSAAAVGLALCVACLVRSHAQANAIGPVINILMAAVGGIMVPTFIMPAAMQRVAALSPMNWALDGLVEALVRGGGLVQVLPQTGRLALFAAAMLLAARFLFSRKTVS